MRRVLTICAAVLFATTSLEARPNHHADNPKVSGEGALLYCEDMSFDFGTIDRRVEDVWHTFIIENQGDEPLAILRVERSCSCMKVSLSKRPLAPGERRTMKVTYEVRKMPPGLFSKVVQIYSTSRDSGFAQFTITGRSVKVEK